MLISFRADAFKAAWKEALATCKPDTLGPLILVSLRALRDLYKALPYAWFLPTALLAALVLDVKSLMLAFYVTLIIRAARPSIDLKKLHYWQNINFVDWVVFFALLIAIEGIPALLHHRTGLVISSIYSYLLKGVFLGNNFSWLPGSSLLGVVTYFLSPLVILALLFLLDSRETVAAYIKAFGRAFLMLLYNYPFFLISYVALRLLITAVYLATQPFITTYKYLPHFGWALFFGLLLPFYFCFIMSFYVKKVHEQFGLYYRS